MDRGEVWRGRERTKSSASRHREPQGGESTGAFLFCFVSFVRTALSKKPDLRSAVPEILWV
jgi:hypothetical protein